MPVSFYGQFYLAITDFHFYTQVFRQPLRKTLLFLLYLSAHLALILTLFFAWKLFPLFDDFTAWARSALPAFKVESGVLEVTAEQPVVRRYESNQEVITFIFDTTGTYSDTQGLEDPVFLLTRERFLVRFGDQSQTYSWKDFGTFAMEPEQWSGLNRFLKWIYFPLAYSFFLLWGMVGKMVVAVLLSLLSYSVGTRFGIRLSFSSAFTIALYSLVPAVVIDLGVRSAGLEVLYRDLIYLATAAVYTYLATQKCVLPD